MAQQGGGDLHGKIVILSVEDEDDIYNVILYGRNRIPVITIL